MLQNLSPTQNEIQTCSLYQLKGNLLHKNNKDENYQTFEPWNKLSVSTGHEVFFYITQSARFISLVFQFYSQFKSQTRFGYMSVFVI